jgi:pantoate--beta-alanine ligase
MEVFETRDSFSKALDNERNRHSSIGFVPTMGYLHEGHLSLIKASQKDCDITAVSIFVNPTQFGKNEDFDTYPRDLPRDIKLLEKAGVDYLFAPPIKEIYPQYPESQGIKAIVIDSVLSRSLEAEKRPGHFDGVATVVAKLFAIVGRARAYFGEKDFQQLAVIRQLVNSFSFPINVIGCPTIRESDGLAKSSRNVRLDQNERRQAVGIYEALLNGVSGVQSGIDDPGDIENIMVNTLKDHKLENIDYATLVDPETFLRPMKIEKDVRLLIAVRLDSARLIDNMVAQVKKGE